MAARRTRDPRRASWLLELRVALLLLLFASPAPAIQAAGEDVGWCIVCQAPTAAGATRETWKGRTIQVCSAACGDEWHEHRDVHFANLQARGALFDERAMSGDSERSLFSGWMWFGCWVVVGLVCGAIAAYVALGKGLAPLPWLLAGLAFNVVALALLATKPRADLSQLPQGVPDGLRKIATTHAPADCPTCGRPNHPSAQACSHCGAPMSARVKSEAQRSHGKTGTSR